MKIIKLLLLILLLPYISNAQHNVKTAVLTQDITIAYSKTTTIVFPFSIASVDRGSQDILAQKAKGMDNVLQVKAAQKDFSDTNLTVITSDGKVYCFAVCYDEFPASLTFILPAEKAGNLIQFNTDNPNRKELEEAVGFAYHERKRVNGMSAHKYGITLSVTGLYIHNDLLYYRMKIENETNISYDIDQLRFFIKDQKRSNRTASQEIEIQPVAVHPCIRKIPAQSASTFVCTLPKFTIPDKKNLAIHLIENSGGRHLELKVKNRKLLKPVLLGPL